jgi:hypothetical protein
VRRIVLVDLLVVVAAGVLGVGWGRDPSEGTMG